MCTTALYIECLHACNCRFQVYSQQAATLAARLAAYSTVQRELHLSTEAAIPERCSTALSPEKIGRLELCSQRLYEASAWFKQ